MSCTCKLDEGIEYMCQECFDAVATKAKEGVQPPVAAEETPVTVQELRDLAYPHGKDVAILITWTRGCWQIVTVGSDRANADLASEIGQEFAKKLELENMTLLEDKRSDHLK
jgi:hypothetical protein